MSLSLPTQEVDKDQKLIDTMELILKNIKEGVYDDLDKESIRSFVAQYITGEPIKPDPVILKYLFTGWFLHQNLGVPGTISYKTEIQDKKDE